jgi:hypothetical protein
LISGRVVNDIVNIGDLGLNITMVDSVDMGYWIKYLPIDGLLGLSAAPSVEGIPNLRQQLADQLAQPIMVLNTHRNITAALEDSREADPTERNELTLGTDQVDGCSGDWSWVPMAEVGTNSQGGVNVTSISIASASEGGANSVNTNKTPNSGRSAYLTNSNDPIACSYQVEKLIANATGAKLDEDSGWYTTPCNQVSQGQNVSLNLADGGSITLTPADLHVELDDVCYLYVVGWYDENDSQYMFMDLRIGQQFANNHCVASNLAENLVGISDKVSA